MDILIFILVIIQLLRWFSGSASDIVTFFLKDNWLVLVESKVWHFTYFITELRRNGHIVYVDEVFVFFYKELTEFFYSLLNRYIFTKLQNIENRLCAKNFILFWIICMIDELSKRSCCESLVYKQMIFITALLKKSIPHQK
jgi:hypothetical protein